MKQIITLNPPDDLFGQDFIRGLEVHEIMDDWLAGADFSYWFGSPNYSLYIAASFVPSDLVIAVVVNELIWLG